MAQEAIYTKSLGGAEDLLLDADNSTTVIQQRSGKDVEITKINSDTIPYSGTFGVPGMVSIKDELDNKYSKDQTTDLIYTKTEIDDNLYTKDEVYNKTEIDTNIYTKSQVEDLFTISVVQHKSTQLLGTYSLTNTVKTLSFDAFLYTGNGATQSIDTGLNTIDFTSASNGTGYFHDRIAGDGIVKTDAGIATESGIISFKDIVGADGLCKVHIKAISAATSNFIFDGLRGPLKKINTDSTAIESTLASSLIVFTGTGFSIGSAAGINVNAVTYVAYVTLYTHIKWGLTNQGNRYIVAYNPVTNESMTIYKGSVVAGHQIPNPLGVKLDYMEAKSLGSVTSWHTQSTNFSYMSINNTIADTGVKYASFEDTYTSLDASVFNSSYTYISYGFANSETRIIKQYTGTGVVGQEISTNDVKGINKRPARVIIKSTSGATGWYVFDNKRTNDGYSLLLNDTAIENTTDYIDFTSTGFIIKAVSTGTASSGVQYIVIVEFDTDSTGKSGSYFDNPTNTTQLQLDSGLISITNGYSDTGAINKVITKSGTISPTNGWL